MRRRDFLAGLVALGVAPVADALPVLESGSAVVQRSGLAVVHSGEAVLSMKAFTKAVQRLGKSCTQVSHTALVHASTFQRLAEQQRALAVELDRVRVAGLEIRSAAQLKPQGRTFGGAPWPVKRPRTWLARLPIAGVGAL